MGKGPDRTMLLRQQQLLERIIRPPMATGAPHRILMAEATTLYPVATTAGHSRLLVPMTIRVIIPLPIRLPRWSFARVERTLSTSRLHSSCRAR